MAMTTVTHEEPRESAAGIRSETRDLHRALRSLREELEAADWYRRRAEACGDPELGVILRHNMRDEMEHAAMLVEWLRRNDGDQDRRLRERLSTGRSRGDGYTVGPMKE